MLTVTLESNSVQVRATQNFMAGAIDVIVILIGAKDLKYMFSIRKSDDQRCFGSLNMT